MPLLDRQVQIRDLVMGPGTPFVVVQFDAWQLQVRADQSGARAWGHGSWSGAEWGEERIVPIEVSANAHSNVDWMALHQQLAAAFAPVGDATQDVELRWCVGEDQYLMHGRPRMVSADSAVIGQGVARTQCAFVALDPRIYSGVEHVVQLGLPQFEGGLTIPFTVPLFIGGVLVDGRAEVTNAGTTDTGLLLRIDGPMSTPRVALQRPDGVVHRLRFDMDLSAGQFLLVDTAARTVFLNGLPQASQRGRAVGEFPLLPPGTSTLRFNHSGPFNEIATLGAAWRDAWW